jgi:hypothetical protein
LLATTLDSLSFGFKSWGRTPKSFEAEAIRVLVATAFEASEGKQGTFGAVLPELDGPTKCVVCKPNHDGAGPRHKLAV